MHCERYQKKKKEKERNTLEAQGGVAKMKHVHNNYNSHNVRQTIGKDQFKNCECLEKKKAYFQLET